MKVVEIVGAYGAIVSSFVAYRQWRLSRPQIEITAVPAYNSSDYAPAGQFVRVAVVNRGATTVYIRHAFVYLLMDWGTWFGRARAFVMYRGRWRTREQLATHMPVGVQATPPFPAMVEAGRSLIIWIPIADYEALWSGDRVRGLQIAVQDETDQTTASKPLGRFGAPALPRTLDAAIR